MRYAKIHRNMTTFWLIVAMVYNYFFYVYFEWRGWTFFSFMNLAVGMQCAAASHAEFMCKPGDYSIRVYCTIVILIGVGLAACNFILAPSDNLVSAWLRTLTLSVAWAIWMHLRVHPIDWESVCYSEMRSSSKVSLTDMIPRSTSFGIYMMTIMGVAKPRPKNIPDCLFLIVVNARLQHIWESTLTYASVTSDLWVGLDEFRKYFDDEGGVVVIALALVFCSLLQLTGTVSKLVTPTKILVV